MNSSSNWSTAITSRPCGRRGGDRLLERPQRVIAGAHERDRPAVAAGEHAVVQRRQQAGLERRRLAAARRPDDAQQRGAGEPRDHLGDEALAAEEDVGVVDFERGEALERAGDDLVGGGRLGGALAGRLQRDDAGGEVVLGGLEARALAGGAVGGGVELAGRLGAGPAARGAVDAQGHALALLHEPRERCVVAVLARDRGDRRGVERAERQVRVRGGLDRREHELRPFEHERLLGDEQDRAPGGLDLRPRGVRRAGPEA